MPKLNEHYGTERKRKNFRYLFDEISNWNRIKWIKRQFELFVWKWKSWRFLFEFLIEKEKNGQWLEKKWKNVYNKIRRTFRFG